MSASRRIFPCGWSPRGLPEWHGVTQATTSGQRNVARPRRGCGSGRVRASTPARMQAYRSSFSPSCLAPAPGARRTAEGPLRARHRTGSAHRCPAGVVDGVADRRGCPDDADLPDPLAAHRVDPCGAAHVAPVRSGSSRRRSGRTRRWSTVGDRAGLAVERSVVSECWWLPMSGRTFPGGSYCRTDRESGRARLTRAPRRAGAYSFSPAGAVGRVDLPLKRSNVRVICWSGEAADTPEACRGAGAAPADSW